MEVTDVQILLYKKQNYLQICANQQLTTSAEVVYRRNHDITEDFCSVWLDDVDLLSICTIYDVVSVVAESNKITMLVDNVLDWDELVDSLFYLIHNVSPNAAIDVIDGGELFVPEVVDHYGCELIYELVS